MRGTILEARHEKAAPSRMASDQLTKKERGPEDAKIGSGKGCPGKAKAVWLSPR